MFMRKALIYLIMVFDVFNSYLSSKTGKPYKTSLNKKVYEYNNDILMQKLSNLASSIDYFYNIDQELMTKSIAELLSMIKPLDFSNYIGITQLNFPPDQATLKKTKKSKDFSRNIKLFNPESKLYDLEIKIWLVEIDEILLAKRKTIDQLLNNSYKAVRRGLSKDFKEESIQKNEKSKPTKRQKKNFDEFFFGEDEVMIKRYWGTKVSKEKICILKKNPKFVKSVNEYLKTKYLMDSINRNVWGKLEIGFQKKVSLKNYMETLLTNKKKNGWLVQNIINAIEELLYCSPETIRKRKTKMKRVKED